MEPMDDFEQQLLLSSFSMASHSLRLLAKAGLLDDDGRTIIRAHLQLLQEKVESLPPDLAELVQLHLDTLTAVLPPTT
jgi:hypothetical protein